MEVGVLVVGGGGHALVSVEALRAGGHDIVGCVTHDGATSAALQRLHVEVLGTDAELAALVRDAYPCVFVAVGDNHARRRLATTVLSAGGSLARAISPSAIISDTATVDDGVLVMPGAVVNACASLERGAIVNTHASIDHGCRIGPFAHVAPGVALAGDVVVGEGALVGVGARVLPGLSIGAWATVGAGAAVVRDVAAGDTVVGVPARPLHQQ